MASDQQHGFYLRQHRMFVPPFPHLQRESLLLHTTQIIWASVGYYWLPRNILTERYRSPRSRKKQQQTKSNNNKRTKKMVSYDDDGVGDGIDQLLSFPKI